MKVGKFEVCYIAPTNRAGRRSHVNYRSFLKVATPLVAMAMMNIRTYAGELSVEEFGARLDETGNKILGMGQKTGYWVAVVMCVWEIIKALKDGDTNAVWGILAKYALAFASLYLIPWIFSIIISLFA